MKTLPLSFAVLFLMISNQLFAGTIIKQESIVGVDSNRNAQLNANSIETGQDILIAREATTTDAGNKDSFVGPNGKTYVPIHSLQDLRGLDTNRDGTITETEMENSATDYVTARFLEGSNDIIPERAIEEEFTSIRLPTKAGDPAIVNIGTDNNLIMEEIKIP